MDYKSCPLKKRPIVYVPTNNYMDHQQQDKPQDLSLKRKSSAIIEEIYDSESKRLCPLDLSMPSSGNYNNNNNDTLSYMNPINWYQQNSYLQVRSDSPLSDSTISRSSSVSPTTTIYNDQTKSEYSETFSYKSYETQKSPNYSSNNSNTSSSPPPLEPEDLSIQNYIPLPALNYGLPETSQHHDHQNNIRFNCDKCGKSYSTYSGITKHLDFHCPKNANKIPKKAFNCLDCQKEYTTLGALKMHIRTHTLPCKCEICGKSFSRPWLLRGHIRTHTGEKPFSCEFCPRAFADKSNLRSHQQIHANIKKYICNKCNRSFSRMSLLKKHIDDFCY